MGLKDEAQLSLAGMRDKLIQLSHQIHAHPEVGWEEIKAARWLGEHLSDGGFSVHAQAGGLPTAFVARTGSGPFHVAICAEYDSLPGIGHACGHNIIAATAVGTAIVLGRIADHLGLTVSVIGTPAEEAGDNGGKIALLNQQVFDGVHLAMMVHPAPHDVAAPKIIAASMFEVNYTGKEAHAAAYPELGINAADALTVAQSAIGMLRQHIRHSDRIHGIVTKGGDAPNIVPAHTSARYIIRSDTLADMDDLRMKVRRCFEAGAVATGSTLEYEGGDNPYAEMLHDLEIAAIYQRNAEAMGRTFPDLGAAGERAAGSTDMGNVSLAVPSIHPFISIDSLPAVNHQPEFAAHCVSEAADKALIDGATSMAWTVIDVASNQAIKQRLTAAN